MICKQKFIRNGLQNTLKAFIFIIFTIYYYPVLSQDSISPSVYKEIVKLVHYYHYKKPPVQQFLETSSIKQINLFLKKFDPYSQYITNARQQFHERRAQESRIGIGINIVGNSRKLLAIPIQKSPAYYAGLKKAGCLLTINDRKIDIENFETFSFLTQFAVGEKVTLSVSDTGLLDDSTKFYQITVKKYHNASVEWVSHPRVNLIRIHQFISNTTKELTELLGKAKKNNKKIVIDLRFSPGGSLFEAVDSASLFLPADVPVVYLNSAHQSKYKILYSLPDRVIHKKVDILISPYTASAAEVFAKALQFYGSAQLVGTESYGKCLSQKTFKLSNDAVLKLSVFEMFPPTHNNQYSCENYLLSPDIYIDPHFILDIPNIY